MSVAVQKLVQAFTLTYANYISLAIYALYQLSVLGDHSYRPVGGWRRRTSWWSYVHQVVIRWSSGGQGKAIDIPNVLL